MLSDANNKAANAELLSHHVHQGCSEIWHISCIVCDLPKLDLPNTIQIGMLDHLRKWIFNFMITHKRLDNYNPIWLSVPAYHDLTPKDKSYEEVFESNGKELKEISQYLLWVVTQSQQGGSPAQHPIFNHTIAHRRALLEFYTYGRHKSHDNATLSYMEAILRRFHTFKDVFLLGQAGNKAKAKANSLRTELEKKWKIHEERNAKTWTPSKKWRKMNGR
jgi:hypothetical protein